MLHSTFAAIEDGENIAARALGQPETAFRWDAVRLLVTRFDANRQGELAGLMQAYLGRTLAPQRQDVSTLIGPADEQVSAIYEADYRDFNRETYMRARESFDATWAGVKRLLYGTWRRMRKSEKQRPDGSNCRKRYIGSERSISELYRQAIFTRCGFDDFEDQHR